MNQRLKCIIVDDEPMSLKLIKSYIDKIPYLLLVDCFEDALEAREFLENNEVAILYADIQMPAMTGLDLVRSLPNPPAVILISGYRDFASEGFEIEAIDYLVKPFSFERFEKATDRATNTIVKDAVYKPPKTNLDFIFIKSGQNYEKLLFNDILYFEAAGDFVKVELSKKKHIVWRCKMMEIESNLPENAFQRIHKSYIVNINSIRSIGTHTVILFENIELPLSAAHRNSLRMKVGLK